MSFGGATQAMITSLKNNKKLLNKRKSLKDNMGGYSNGNNPVEFKTPNANAYELSKIKRKLQKENSQVFYKRVIILIAFLTVLISVLYYFA
ncbi:hypothetical protein [Formosa algae]|uniref:hypothetical protein n=1 Tax=Formosa algae TaxID=225843 RepID=UPI000CCF21F8|nr:hypothetical protein [Formosa algae]PNW26797.1 hypothetical protein BKP44_15575 [Formosa algae]